MEKKQDKIDVCICTHNPRQSVLELVVGALARQSVSAGSFQVILVDNASAPAISESVLQPLRARGIEARIVVERQLGLSRARIRAVEETDREWVLFVDDDNELAPDFIERGLAIISTSERLGCFGGKLLLPSHLNPGRWVTPFLPYLGIKDNGDQAIVGDKDEWGPWEPAGAGAWVHRQVLEAYRRQSIENDNFFKLGRSGTRNLASCDDSFLMRGACRLGMTSAYMPELVLTHHISPHRFSVKYLIKLMHAYGGSHVMLETLLKGAHPVPRYYQTIREFVKLLIWVFDTERRKSLAFAVAQLAYHFGARAEYHRCSDGNRQ